ncbi:hypothetical protein MKW92_009023 [Papaver armeniacum]|nr:hypothetical protein MKW92_009023 [Papaver armeniacum]
MSIMKNTKLNLVHFISLLFFSLIILSVSAQKTNPGDVAGIKQLISTFAMLGYNETFAELPEDPCLPTPYPWVTCSSDDTPRITALNCGNRKPKLLGALPDFTSMDALKIIDFENNLVVGEFPDFLAEFPELEELNLANNTLTGTVPTSLQKNKNLKLTLTGNKYLCFSDEKECKPTEYIEGTVVNYPPGMPGMPAMPGTAGTPGKNAGSRKNSLQIILGSVTSIFVMFWFIV